MKTFLRVLRKGADTDMLMSETADGVTLCCLND